MECTTNFAPEQLAGVQTASDRFYAALNRLFTGDVAPMLAVWAHSPELTQMGPFGGRREGWDAMRDEFVQTSQMTQSGHVEPTDLLIRVDGELGYTVCVEQGELVDRQGNRIPVNHRATSI